MKQYILKSEPSLINFSAELNPAQLDAVMFDQGPALVIAGAGSGKTRTLVYRVARLVEKGVKPEAILLLTFTRKASDEMLKRATRILDNRCQNVSGGTFHAFANICLKKYSACIGYNPRFTILDRSDADDLIGHIRKEMGYGKSEKRFPKKHSVGDMISKSVNTGKDISKIIAEEYPHFYDFHEDIKKITAEYQNQKKNLQVMDYDDLLLNLGILLKNNHEILAKINSKYQYIMVDEYQDTNKIQAEIIYMLSGDKKNVMVVGDDSQSIYSFRGANFKNIMDFPKLFHGARIITLEQNYRSTQPILDLTNSIIAKSREKFSKNLFTLEKSKDKPIYIETKNEAEQSSFICQKILELREAEVPLSEIAVLFRSSYHSNDLEIELKSRDIPFVKYGGIKFMEASHIKDVICFFRIIANIYDLLSWQRILLLFDGIGTIGAQKIIQEIIISKSTLPAMELKPYKNKPFYKELEKLIKLIAGKKEINKIKPGLLLEEILSFYKPLFKNRYDDHNKREKDLESLQTISERFKTVDEFLTSMSLEPPDSTQELSLPSDGDKEKMTLSTIHSAKGLEWHTVFILSALDGYLPSFKSLGSFEQIEEERRLMYVALTRAKKNLFILKPNLDFNSPQHFWAYQGMQFSRLSRFLEEGNLIDKHTEKWLLVDKKNNSNKKKYIL